MPNPTSYDSPEDDDAAALYIAAFNEAFPRHNRPMDSDKNRRWQLAAHAAAAKALFNALADARAASQAAA
jgi:hypothetical protein